MACCLCGNDSEVRHCPLCGHDFCETCRALYFDRGLAAFKQFMKYAQDLVDKERKGPHGTPQLGFTKGPKFIRVYTDEVGQGKSAFCFVGTKTGSVYKADGWKKPAKGARGSIFTPNRYGISAYGGLYAR